jgi:hypothetical protein
VVRIYDQSRSLSSLLLVTLGFACVDWWQLSSALLNSLCWMQTLAVFSDKWGSESISILGLFWRHNSTLFNFRHIVSFFILVKNESIYIVTATWVYINTTIYVYIDTATWICINTATHVYISRAAHVYINRATHVHISTAACIYINGATHVHISTPVYSTHVHISTPAYSTHVYISTAWHVCLHQCMYIHLHQ